MEGLGLRPKVKIECPLCGEQMKFDYINRTSDTSISWVLAPTSYAHLGSCNGKEEAPFGSEESRGHVRSAPDSREGTPSDQGPLWPRQLQAA